MAERRSAQRLTPATELSARVRAFLPARVVDVSRTGIQLELSSLLRIGVSCDVKLTLEGAELRWPAPCAAAALPSSVWMNAGKRCSFTVPVWSLPA